MENLKFRMLKLNELYLFLSKLTLETYTYFLSFILRKTESLNFFGSF